MLQKIVIQFKYSGEQQANYNWGSLMHGALLEMMPPGVVDALHHSQLRPFSQYVIPDTRNRLSWHIGIWDDEVAKIIVPALLALKVLPIKHKGINMEVMSVQNNIESLQEYSSRFFTAASTSHRYEIQFLTPCTHKRDGKYVIFPAIDLIINSLTQRYCTFIQDISLDDPEVMGHLVSHLNIVRYSLRTAVYHLDSTRITGYMGMITVHIRGPEQLARLAGLILSFGEYAGLGVKTALGMGGIKVTPKYLPAASSKRE